MLTYQIEQWQNNAWVQTSLNTYSYDLNRNKLTDLSEKWQDDKWVNLSKVTYLSYDLNGNQISDIHEIWQNEQWLYYWRATYTYDIDGNRLTQLYDNWTVDKWVSTDRWAYSYDSKGNMITELTEYWKTDQWLADERGTYNYNIAGKRTAELYEGFQNGFWVNLEHYTFSYNSNGNYLTGQCEDWNGNWNSSNKGTFTIAGSKILPEIFYGYKIEVTYKGTNSVTEERNNNLISLNCSPNPTSFLTTINYSIIEPCMVSITLTNSLGNEAARISNNQFQESGFYSLNFDAGNLAPGIYYLTIKAGNMIETKKFVVVR
jgi:hypothetical protein